VRQDSDAIRRDLVAPGVVPSLALEAYHYIGRTTTSTTAHLDSRLRHAGLLVLLAVVVLLLLL
jgi:hypothetical protein